MESKSHDELSTVLLNSLETLSKRMEKLEEVIKKQNELTSANTLSVVELSKTVTTSNKVFDQVAQGVKDLYEKVKSMELIAKMMGNLGPLLGSLGGQKK